MKVEGQQTYEANREVVWALLHDPLILEQLLPGCESLEAVSPDEYRATLTIRVGQTVERFAGIIRFERVINRQSFNFIADGQNPDGAVICRGRVVLDDRGPEVTSLTYNAEFEVTGRPAGVAPRLLETTARAFARRSLEALQNQVAIRTRTYTTTSLPVSTVTRSGPFNDNLEHQDLRRRFLVVISVVLAALFLWQRVDRRRTRLVAQQVAEGLDKAGPQPPSPRSVG